MFLKNYTCSSNINETNLIIKLRKDKIIKRTTNVNESFEYFVLFIMCWRYKVSFVSKLFLILINHNRFSVSIL